MNEKPNISIAWRYDAKESFQRTGTNNKFPGVTLRIRNPRYSDEITDQVWQANTFLEDDMEQIYRFPTTRMLNGKVQNVMACFIPVRNMFEPKLQSIVSVSKVTCATLAANRKPSFSRPVASRARSLVVLENLEAIHRHGLTALMTTLP